MVIRYWDNPKKKQELIELKHKIVDLKKDMIFKKMVDDKFVFSELNTPRSFRSADFSDDLLQSVRSFNSDPDILTSNRLKLTDPNRTLTNDDQLQLTNRTNKSVRFDNTLNMNSTLNDTLNSTTNVNNETADGKSKSETDEVSERAVNKRYQRIIELLGKEKKAGDDLSLSLSLPLSSRSFDQENNQLNDLMDEYEMFKSVYQEIEEYKKEDEKNRRFIQE